MAYTVMVVVQQLALGGALEIACIVMAYIVMAYIVMAFFVMAYTVMAYMVMAAYVMSYSYGRAGRRALARHDENGLCTV